jgi:hypothetical protein
VAILPCVAPCRHSFLSAALPSAIYFCSFLPARFPPAFASIIYQWIRTGTTRSVSIFKNCEVCFYCYCGKGRISVMRVYNNIKGHVST